MSSPMSAPSQHLARSAPLTPTGAARRALALSDWRPTGRKGQAVAVRPSFHARSPAALLDSAFEALRAAVGTLFALSALGNLPLAAVLAGLILWVRERGHTWGSPSYFLGVGGLSAGLALAAWVRALATGAMSYAALAALSGRGASLAEAAAHAFRSGSALALGAAVRLVAVVGGSLACLLPAALAYFALALLPTAIVAERLSVSEAAVRSSRLLPHALGGSFVALL